MLLFVGIALIILIPTIILHYSQHFRISFYKQPKQSLELFQLSSSPPAPQQKPEQQSRVRSESSIQQKQIHRNKSICNKYCLDKYCCHCSIRSVDNEQFDFFPMSFLCYLIFTFLICIMIIILQIIDSIESNNINLFPINIFNTNSHSISKLHKMNVSDPTSTSLWICICDYIIIYGFMVLAVWESLFSC